MLRPHPSPVLNYSGCRRSNVRPPPYGLTPYRKFVLLQGEGRTKCAKQTHLGSFWTRLGWRIQLVINYFHLIRNSLGWKPNLQNRVHLVYNTLSRLRHPPHVELIKGEGTKFVHLTQFTLCVMTGRKTPVVGWAFSPTTSLVVIRFLVGCHCEKIARFLWQSLLSIPTHIRNFRKAQVRLRPPWLGRYYHLQTQT